MHSLVRAAMTRAMTPPVSVLHGTRPSPPRLTSRDLARVAIWAAQRVSARNEPRRKALAGALERIDESERGYVDPDGDAIDRAARVGATAIDHALEAAYRSDFNPAATNIAAKRATKVAAQTVRKARGDVAAFVAALDDHVYVIEAAALIRAKVEDAAAITPRIARVMFRAEADTPDRLGHVIVKLDGTWGLLAKLKGRFRWFEATRDEILATVPDLAFAEAVDVALARES